MFRQKVIAEQVDHDTREAAATGGNDLLTGANHRVAIGEAVDLAMQSNATADFGSIASLERAFHKIAQHSAQDHFWAVAGQVSVGEVVHCKNKKGRSHLRRPNHPNGNEL